MGKGQLSCPAHKRPVVSSPSAFGGEILVANNSFTDLDWWHVDPDTTLQQSNQP